MKKMMVLMLLLSTLSGFGQMKGYKYEYKLHLDYAHELNQVLTDTGFYQSYTEIKLRLTTLYGEPLVVSTVKLIGVDTAIGFTDEDGRIIMRTRPGKYHLVASSPGYKGFETWIELKPGNMLEFQLKLGRSKSLVIYDVYSKKALSERVLTEIKECLETNHDPKISCNKKGEYYIMIEI